MHHHEEVLERKEINVDYNNKIIENRTRMLRFPAPLYTGPILRTWTHTLRGMLTNSRVPGGESRGCERITSQRERRSMENYNNNNTC